MSEQQSTDSEQVVASTIDFVTRELVGQRTDVDVGPEDDLLTSGLVDSLGVMRLIRHLEETYNVTVPAADVTIENFVTVATIAGYLERLRSQNEGRASS